MVELDQTGDVPVGEQLVAQVVAAIRDGRLAPDDRLPTIRSLARDLDVAPGTVARAYSELERSGWVSSDGRRGTKVSAEPADRVDPIVRSAAVTMAHAVLAAGMSRADAHRALDVAFASLRVS